MIPSTGNSKTSLEVMYEKQKSQLQTMKKVLTYIRSYRIFLVLSLIFAIVAVASTLYFPVLTGQVIDHILAPGR